MGTCTYSHIRGHEKGEYEMKCSRCLVENDRDIKMVNMGKESTTLTADIAHRDVGDKINGNMGKWRQKDLVQGSVN